MGETVPAPLAGFVNAPFFARLDRRSLDTEIPLNDLLLDQVALLCARTTQLALRGELELAPAILVDLITWRKPVLPRLVKAPSAGKRSSNSARDQLRDLLVHAMSSDWT